MNNAALPAVLLVGGAIYVLQTQAPPTTLPPAIPGGPSNVVQPNGSAWDPMNLASAPGTNPGDAQKTDALLAAAYAKFQTMSDAEKVNAAQQINSTYNVQPPLTGNESWQSIASVLGGAIGGAYGGPLGAIAGAYLGVTLEGWMATSIDDIKTWINQNVPGVVDGVVDDVKNWLGSIV